VQDEAKQDEARQDAALIAATICGFRNGTNSWRINETEVSTLREAAAVLAALPKPLRCQIEGAGQLRSFALPGPEKDEREARMKVLLPHIERALNGANIPHGDVVLRVGRSKISVARSAFLAWVRDYDFSPGAGFSIQDAGEIRVGIGEKLYQTMTLSPWAADWAHFERDSWHANDRPSVRVPLLSGR
jgi:hypothetical protein